MNRRTALRAGVWLVVAIVLTMPLLPDIGSVLLGDPRIDVWNHAWGYDWVARHVASGSVPFHTPWIGGPDGGTLWFIDMVGAMAALPLTLWGGAALGYNVVLIARIAWAGFGAQQLAEHVWGREHGAGWFAGLAYATSPFLLAELSNGISEVCATGWLPLTLWAAARALENPSLRRWALLGLLQGVATVTTFYYGLTSAALVALFLGLHIVSERRAGRALDRRLAPGLLLAAGVGALLVVPHWAAFRASLAAPDALVRRSADLNLALMAHNAVDPRVFLLPGDFQSVDLATVYGEPFVHTGYLRWTVLTLAGLGVVVGRRHRRWAVLAVASLVMGLGPYLWWDGEWLTVGGRMISLPFGWLRALLPQLAITHPLRLSLGAQALACVLAGGGAAWVAARVRRPRTAVLGLGVAAVAETLMGSVATFPLPTSDARVPEAYADVPEGMVLDLPAEVGTTMETSRYFWMQTRHGRPIPWTPDARLGSARDPETFHGIAQPSDPADPGPETPRRPDVRTVQHIRDTYGLIVVHTDLEDRAGMTTSYVDALTPALGPPSWDGPRAVWHLR